MISLSGCNVSKDAVEAATETRLTPAAIEKMETQGIDKRAPIAIRIFKEEAVLEVWKRKKDGTFGLVANYDICKWSGKLGPKFAEGDRQAPEGFYAVTPGQMNPNSKYHLSFNIGYPNAFDRANGRYGTYIMVHGACSSAGCYSMTDPQIEEIYAFARDAFRGGQRAFQVQAYPFRMTDENMSRYKADPNIDFWQMIKVGYDYFEETKKTPSVRVCDKRYVFNSDLSGGCPAPQVAAFKTTITQTTNGYGFVEKPINYAAPLPSIAGIDEAALVADWSKRRQKGEKVTPTPPSIMDVPREQVDAISKPVKAKIAQIAKFAAMPRAPQPVASVVVSNPNAPRRF